MGLRRPSTTFGTPPYSACMRGLLLSSTMARRHADLLERLSRSDQAHGDPITPVLIPEGENGALPEDVLSSIRAAFISTDVIADPRIERRGFGTARRAPNLEWLHIGFAGTDTPIFRELMDRGVTVTNSSGAASEPIAVTVIAGMLALNRGFPRWGVLQQRREWRQRQYAPPDLRGQTIVVLGLGSIGTEVARLARVFGLHVIGVRRTPAGPADGVDEWVPPARLDEVLPRADWLAITIPLTPETHHMIDATALARLPQGANILNVARGAIIDEPALIEALRSGYLGGAYLDVFEVEPLPETSPLWDLPNVIVTPHDSNASAGNTARFDAIFVEQLELWAAGKPLTRTVGAG
ncbi:MAG: D-2-hydroxyacid dehydrogenase [Dehalococcoidia bacterium]|nr:MAG: D-2-hydroxyacid dehydrogenase [Dehalococcoidia bacterium]